MNDDDLELASAAAGDDHNQLPVVSVLMPAEPVYVYLGTQLPASGWISLLACVVGTRIGNQGSYWLGRTAGDGAVNAMAMVVQHPVELHGRKRFAVAD